MARRALKRLKGEDVFGYKINVIEKKAYHSNICRRKTSENPYKINFNATGNGWFNGFVKKISQKILKKKTVSKKTKYKN